jgi:hypothetical protein
LGNIIHGAPAQAIQRSASDMAPQLIFALRRHYVH